MSAHVSHIPELDDLIERGSPGKRATTLERMTAFFVDGASRFNDDHVRLFDVVFSRLIGEIESTARTELSRRLAPVGKAPIETVRRLAHDDDIAVAGPLLERADRLSDADLADIAASKGQAHLLAISRRKTLAEPAAAPPMLPRPMTATLCRFVCEKEGDAMPPWSGRTAKCQMGAARSAAASRLRISNSDSGGDNANSRRVRRDTWTPQCRYRARRSS